MGVGRKIHSDAAPQLPVFRKVLPKGNARTQNRLVVSRSGLSGGGSNSKKERNRSILRLVQHQLRRDYHVTKTGGGRQDAGTLKAVKKGHGQAQLQTAIERDEQSRLADELVTRPRSSSVESKSRIEFAAEEPRGSVNPATASRLKRPMS